MKKLIFMLLILVSSTLIACENSQTITTEDTSEENINKPVFGDMDDLIGYLNESINLFEDVSVTDEEDGDLIEEVTIINLIDLPILNGLVDSTGGLYYTLSGS